MDVNLSIHDLSMEDLEYLQNHPYLAEYRDVQSKIQKEINDRKQGLSFCPADHTIFVYHGFHRVENVETTNTVSLRTTEGKPYQLTLDVLNIEGHHFYATYCGNLPKTTYLLGRLLPVEILNANNDNIWVDKAIQYGIYRPAHRGKARKEYLQNLLAYRIYSKDELDKIFSSYNEKFLNNSYMLSYILEDKKYVSSIPKPKIDDLFRELNEIKEAKQAVSFDFAVDENGVFDYSPSKHTIVFGVSKKKIKTYKQYTMRVLSNPHTVISIPVYHDPAKNHFIVMQKDLLSKSTILVKLYDANSQKEATLMMLRCGYYNNILYPRVSRKQFLYDLLQFNLTDRETIISCLKKNKNQSYSKIVMNDMAYIQTLSNDVLKKFQTHQYYDSTLFKLLHEPSLSTKNKKQDSRIADAKKQDNFLEESLKQPYAIDTSQLQVSDFYLDELKDMMYHKQESNKITQSDIVAEIKKEPIKEYFQLLRMSYILLIWIGGE